MMILRIGKSLFYKSFISNNKGISFVEVMLAVAILSAGITAIFRSYLVSLDRINYLTNRLHANAVLDNQISSIERNLKAYNALPYELEPVIEMDFGHRMMEYQQKLSIGTIDEFVDVFKIELSLAWDEKGRDIRITRGAYVTNFGEIK